MVCNKCGSSNGEMREGISKKNNKPWKGFKCNDCNEMTFVRTNGGQSGQGVPQAAQNVFAPKDESLVALHRIATSLEKLVAIYERSQEPLEKVAKESGAYDENIVDDGSPF